MRCLIIIGKEDEFKDTWDFEEELTECFKGNSSTENKLILCKTTEKIDSTWLYGFIDKPFKMLGNLANIEIGLIFHYNHGSVEADKLRKKIFDEKKGIDLTICDWYSSQRHEFWDSDKDEYESDKPYNKLIRAWKDEDGLDEDRIQSFDAVWNFFFGDAKEEKLTERIFKAIYNREGEEVIQEAIKERDQYLLTKQSKRQTNN